MKRRILAIASTALLLRAEAAGIWPPNVWDPDLWDAKLWATDGAEPPSPQPPLAASVVVRSKLIRNPDGTYDTRYPLGDKYPQVTDLACSEAHLAPSLVGLIAGSSHSEDASAYFSGTAKGSVDSYSIVSVSGDDPATVGFTIDPTDGNPFAASTLHVGAGVLRIRATIGTAHVDCPAREFSVVDAPLGDLIAPTLVTGIVATPGPNVGEVTVSWDPADDPRGDDGAVGSGVASYLVTYEGGTKLVTTGVHPGYSPNWLANPVAVKAFSPAPTFDQDGTAITITAAGAGFHGTADEYAFAAVPVTGAFRLTAKLGSMTGNTGTFSAMGLMVSSANPADGGAELAARHATYWQDAGPGYSALYQTKMRPSYGATATNRYSSTAASNGGCVQIARASGSSQIIEARHSLDCITWEDHPPQTLSLPETVWVGPFASAVNAGNPIEAEFEWIALTPYERLTTTITADAGNLTVTAIDTAANDTTSGLVAYTPLTGSGGGGGNDLPPFRFNPGTHIVFGAGITSKGTSTTSLRNTVANQLAPLGSKITGFQVRIEPKWIWKDQNTWDWTLTDQISEIAADYGLQWSIMLLDKTFNSQVLSNCSMPTFVVDTAWRNDDPPNSGCYFFQQNGGGTGTAIWRSDVRAYFIQFIHAFCARYANDLHFEGIFGTESTPSLASNQKPYGYEGIGDFLAAIRQIVLAYPGSPCDLAGIPYYAPLNHPTGDSTSVKNMHLSVVQAIAATPGTGITGPDVCPNKQCFSGGSVNGQRAYIGAQWGTMDYRGIIPAAWQVQGAGFDRPLTFEIILPFMRNELKQSHMFLMYETRDTCNENTGVQMNWFRGAGSFYCAGDPTNYGPGLKYRIQNDVNDFSPGLTTCPTSWQGRGCASRED